MIPMQDWYAPPLNATRREVETTVALLAGFIRGQAGFVAFFVVMSVGIVCGWFPWRGQPLRVLVKGFYVMSALALIGFGFAMDDPMRPRLVATLALPDVRGSALQFRYLFATTDAGLQTIDITHPEKAVVLPSALVPLADARRVYLVRTYAYVAAGAEGLAIVDITKPEAPSLLNKFTANGQIRDASDVKVGATNASLFAYVADGAAGLKVIQLMAPDTQPGFYGFSPEPRPQLIASHKTRMPALSLSEGLHRDRAVDESGGQIAVFGRIGSRPFTLEEERKFFLNADGEPWFVSNQLQ